MDVEQQIYPEDADETLINDAFETLLNSYLASRHRKKVDLITKAFNFAKLKISPTSLVRRLQ